MVFSSRIHHLLRLSACPAIEPFETSQRPPTTLDCSSIPEEAQIMELEDGDDARWPWSTTTTDNQQQARMVPPQQMVPSDGNGLITTETHDVNWLHAQPSVDHSLSWGDIGDTLAGNVLFDADTGSSTTHYTQWPQPLLGHSVSADLDCQGLQYGDLTNGMPPAMLPAPIAEESSAFSYGWQNDITSASSLGVSNAVHMGAAASLLDSTWLAPFADEERTSSQRLWHGLGFDHLLTPDRMDALPQGSSQAAQLSTQDGLHPDIRRSDYHIPPRIQATGSQEQAVLDVSLQPPTVQPSIPICDPAATQQTALRHLMPAPLPSVSSTPGRVSHPDVTSGHTPSRVQTTRKQKSGRDQICTSASTVFGPKRKPQKRNGQSHQKSTAGLHNFKVNLNSAVPRHNSRHGRALTADERAVRKQGSCVLCRHRQKKVITVYEDFQSCCDLG